MEAIILITLKFLKNASAKAIWEATFMNYVIEGRFEILI